MCGIFGVLGSGRPTQALKLFESLSARGERRGSDAFGMFFYSSVDDDISVFKQAGGASYLAKSTEYLQFVSNISERLFRSANYLAIGHTRLATNGSPHDSENNQPISLGDWTVVHNGIIVNDSAIKREVFGTNEFRLSLDTYALLGLLNKNFEKRQQLDSVELCRLISQKIKGANSFAIWSKKFKRLVLFSSNGSLYVRQNGGDILFSSEAHFLENVKGMKDGEIFNIKSPLAGAWDFSTNKFEIVNFESADWAISDGVTEQVQQGLRESRSAYNCDPNTQRLILCMESEFMRVLQLMEHVQRCRQCLLPIHFPGLNFGSDGRCGLCLNHESLRPKRNVRDLAELLKNDDGVLVSLSGGRDSTYSLHFLKKEIGLNKIKAFTYDWGMVTDLARRNQSRICGELGVEHIIVAADIAKKRRNIRNNVIAWLKKPKLGLVPLFMAGDKHYFYYAEKIRKENCLAHTVMGENKLEKTGFKTGFAGAVQRGVHSSMAYHLSIKNKAKMLSFYGFEFLKNTGYWNSSLGDTLTGYLAYYVQPHKYVNIFDYVPWNEPDVERVLSLYDWEYATDCSTSWRIGDGTAAFYNYIYFTLAGFSENDTLRANQIREGHLSIEEAKRLIKEDNRPRVDSFKWYCETLEIDPVAVAEAINNASKIIHS